jgi:hypothetical protein
MFADKVLVVGKRDVRTYTPAKGELAWQVESGAVLAGVRTLCPGRDRPGRRDGGGRDQDDGGG